jgi:hypothetical protein
MAFTPGNINSMMDSILQSGVAHGNRYEMIILPPRELTVDFSFLQQLSVRCSSISIPSKSLATQSNRLYGPARNFPFEMTYPGELNATFILSADLRERQFFDAWLDYICNPQDFKMEYYDNYVTEIQINALNRDDGFYHVCTLEEAYPKSVGEIQLGYDKDGDLMQQEVSFHFRKFRSDYVSYR